MPAAFSRVVSALSLVLVLNDANQAIRLPYSSPFPVFRKECVTPLRQTSNLAQRRILEPLTQDSHEFAALGSVPGGCLRFVDGKMVFRGELGLGT